MMTEKKQCIVITAYKEPDTLRELLKILNKRFRCFVHIDKKAERAFECLKLEFEDVYFVSKYDVKWGGIEHLCAIVDLLRQTLNYKYSYVHIISGEDFPTQDVEMIENYFENKTGIYMQCVPCLKKSRRARWYRFYWPYTKLRQNYKNPMVRYINLIAVGVQVIFPFLQKKKMGEFGNIYGGLVWSSLPEDVVDYIVQYLQNDKMNICEAMEWCKIPEELCFQTILANSRFASRIINDYKHYCNFDGGDGSGPIYLELSDIAKIDSMKCFFARKIKMDSEVMQILKGRQKSAD